MYIFILFINYIGFIKNIFFLHFIEIKDNNPTPVT